MENPEHPKPALSKDVTVHQEKSNFFRVIHSDGAWCSVNLYKHIHLTFYSERYPIPKRVFFEVDSNGVTTENPERRDIKKDWFREMEVDVVLSLGAAKQVHENLGKFIKTIEQME